MKTRDAQSVADAIASYTRLGDELHDDSVRAELCGCEKCKIMASEAACSMMICGAAIHALRGEPAMLSEILGYLKNLTEKYPSPNK